jgi:hypothetical protein
MMNNPPFPTGFQLLAQSAVTAEMTSALQSCDPW